VVLGIEFVWLFEREWWAGAAMQQALAPSAVSGLDAYRGIAWERLRVCQNTVGLFNDATLPFLSTISFNLGKTVLSQLRVPPPLMT
jgi:hypothetical protein